MDRDDIRKVLAKDAKLYIFDMDGTILNTLEDLTNATNQALRECGYPEHTMEDVKGFVGNGIGMLIRRALPPECDADPEAYEMTLQAFKRYYFLHNNDTTAPYPCIPELIDALQEKGLKLAVVSNKNDPNVKALCQYYFPSIPLAVGEREGIRRKPEPDTVLHVMKEFGSAKCHTLYVGDSDVGQRVNFGCGTVTTNYNGLKKFRCTVGDDVFLGCNTNLIAPVTIGDGAYTAAGSTIDKDVPAGALAVARARQENKPGWAARFFKNKKK